MIVHINSPGGTTAGSEQLYDSLARLAGEEADGGRGRWAGRLRRLYRGDVAADHIIAQETSLVGSIGVLFQYPNFTDLLKTIGVKVEEIKSSPLKAAPNGFEPTSPEARAAIEAIVSDSYAWFKDLVKDRRNLDDAQLAAVADGRVFTGRQAVELKLIDELGNEKTALAWLAKEKKHPGQDAGARLFAASRASASCRSCTSPPGPSRRSVFRPGAAARGVGRDAGGRATQP